MKPVKILMAALAAMACLSFVHAQTADEIIAKYFENTGGKAKWEAIQGTKTTAKMTMQGMELPLTIIQLKDGRQSTSLTFQGMTFYDGVFDGTTLWGTNQMTMKPEKSDAETTENFKASLGLDFPDPFLNYASKGYKVELMGKETIDGAETFKIKLTRKPVKVSGVATDNVSYYYFDSKTFLPVMIETDVTQGPAKGMTSQTKMSDYQEVNGLKFPFTIAQGIKGQAGAQTITFSAVELNPQVDPAVFAFPGN